jgi:hypothetical protein
MEVILTGRGWRDANKKTVARHLGRNGHRGIVLSGYEIDPVSPQQVSKNDAHLHLGEGEPDTHPRATAEADQVEGMATLISW